MIMMVSVFCLPALQEVLYAAQHALKMLIFPSVPPLLLTVSSPGAA